MNYEAMLDFLGGRLNYERKGMPDNQELRLDRVAHLLAELGQPQGQYPIVHIAGTKGKGSTSHMVAAMLASNGAKVGLHTSPHFHRIEERFQINGKPAPAQALASLAGEIVPYVDELDSRLEPSQPPLTFFEITTALVLCYFAREKVDWAVIEVGMGGRLDSTNVVHPRVAVITSISRDHMRQLGETPEEIAREKGGIIKPGVPVISGVETVGPRRVIEEIAASSHSRLRQAGVDFSHQYEHRGFAGGSARVQTWRRSWPTIHLPLLGEHQGANVAIASAVMDELVELGLELDPASAAASVASIKIPGRIEIVQRNPTLILDVAHNEASIASLVRTLDSASRSAKMNWNQKILVFGASRDKDWRCMLTILAPAFDHIVLTSFQSNPRALPATEAASALENSSASISLATDPSHALNLACELAKGAGSPKSEALICVTGSFYLIAEAREALCGRTMHTVPEDRS